MFARLLVLLACALSFSAHAQTYPDKPIRIIVPFPAGDGLDLQARMIGQKLVERWGQQVVVENKPGAGTLIGVDAAARSPGDGYTLVLVTTSFAINPALREKVPYDPVKDFVPVIQTTAIPLVIVGSNSFAPNSFAEVLALAKKKPGELTIGNSRRGDRGPHRHGIAQQHGRGELHERRLQGHPAGDDRPDRRSPADVVYLAGASHGVDPRRQDQGAGHDRSEAHGATSAVGHGAGGGRGRL